MDKKIAVSFPMNMEKAQKTQVTEQVNDILNTIKPEVTGWNGFVDFTETRPGYFSLIAQCDNDEIREKMQALIDAADAHRIAS